MLDEKCIITEWNVQSLASRGLFDGCGIYRAEPPGETNDDGHPGTRKGCACKSPITKILVWWIKAVQCTYPLLFLQPVLPKAKACWASSRGLYLIAYIIWYLSVLPRTEGEGDRYALLQGGLFSCGRQENKELPLEPKLNNSKGAVSLITVSFLNCLTSWDGWMNMALNVNQFTADAHEVLSS